MDPDNLLCLRKRVFVVTTDGVLVVDGQGDPKQGQEMVDNIKKLTPQPVKYMIMASDHTDHVGGNATLSLDMGRNLFAQIGEGAVWIFFVEGTLAADQGVDCLGSGGADAVARNRGRGPGVPGQAVRQFNARGAHR